MPSCHLSHLSLVSHSIDHCLPLVRITLKNDSQFLESSRIAINWDQYINQPCTNGILSIQTEYYTEDPLSHRLI